MNDPTDNKPIKADYDDLADYIRELEQYTEFIEEINMELTGGVGIILTDDEAMEWIKHKIRLGRELYPITKNN